MKQQIIDNINNPEILEKLYRGNKKDFCRSFAEVSDNYDSDIVKLWKLRLAQEKEPEKKEFLKQDIIVVILISLLTGFLVKIPDMFPINGVIFNLRNIPIIEFNGIIMYALWKNRISDRSRLLVYGIVMMALFLFMNLLPYSIEIDSDSVNLSMIYSPLLLWCLFGLAFISFDYKNIEKRIEFIRFNGELIIMMILILIAGMLLTAITIGLFYAIGVDITHFYIDYVVVFGSVAIPIVSYFLIKSYPNLTNKIAPVIARVFTPIVLITLVFYLVSFIFSKKMIFEDRELLLWFNIMLVAVMAIIVFSVSELEKAKESNFSVLMLFLLAVVALVINAIALSAIFSRSLNGLTPNRTVVLVSNILFFVNLIWVAKCLFDSYFRGKSLDKVESGVAKYLTAYSFWTIVVVFILPFVFEFK